MDDYDDDVDPFFEVEPLKPIEQTTEPLDSKEQLLLQDENAQLQQKNKHLDNQNMALKRNITCLFKTAKIEIQRYEGRIVELEKQLRSALSELKTKAPTETVNVYTQTEIKREKTKRNCSSRTDQRGLHRESSRRSKHQREGEEKVKNQREKHSQNTEQSRPTRATRHKTKGLLTQENGYKHSKRRRVEAATNNETTDKIKNERHLSDLEEGEIVSSDCEM